MNRGQSEQKERTWLGDIDYSSGAMQFTRADDASKFDSLPFFVAKKKRESYDYYVAEAHKTLVQVLDDYKNIHGKTQVD